MCVHCYEHNRLTVTVYEVIGNFVNLIENVPVYVYELPATVLLKKIFLYFFSVKGLWGISCILHLCRDHCCRASCGRPIPLQVVTFANLPWCGEKRKKKKEKKYSASIWLAAPGHRANSRSCHGECDFGIDGRRRRGGDRGVTERERAPPDSQEQRANI